MQAALVDNLKIYGLQVSGKAPKFITQDETRILKGAINEQVAFFEHIYTSHYTHPHAAIKRHIPIYHGTTLISQQQSELIFEKSMNQNVNKWLDHLKSRHNIRNSNHKYLSLNNFTKGFQYPNVLDFKIGNRSEKPHKITRSVSDYRVRLNGMYRSGRGFPQQFRSKYMLNQVSSAQEIQDHIAWFFYDNENKCLNEQYLCRIISTLKQIILCVRSLRGFKFCSSSICIFYDESRPDSCEAKFIDFGRTKQIDSIENNTYDRQTSRGMQSILYFMLRIIQNKEKYKQFELPLPEYKIPEQKLQKYVTPKKQKAGKAQE